MSSGWLDRPRRLRRLLVGALLLVTLASVLLVGIENFVAARRLLDEGTREQMQSVGEMRARSVEVGGEELLAQVSAAAGDLGVVSSLADLSEGYTELSVESLTPAQDAELVAFYQERVIDPLNALDLDQLGELSVEDVEPVADRARYLQYHYSLADGDVRAEITDAGDGSSYSEHHAQHHPFLSSFAQSLGVNDLLLVNDEGRVVYSWQKRIDLGTDMINGPFADSVLASTLRRDLADARIGDAVLGDYEVYLPGGAEPVIFSAAAIRDDSDVLGAFVVQFDAEALSAFTTAEGEWEAVGLGDGESYVVSAEGLLLQSESRLWIEDPERYLSKLDDEQARLIEALGSPVGLQVVDTEPVREAVDGRRFLGSSTNYLGQDTLSYSTPMDIGETRWVMVAEIPSADARAPLFTYARRLGMVILVILPIAALLGFWLADRLTRPIRPVVEAALAVAEGERDPQLPDLGRDEFGDLARRLRAMARQLGEREEELAEEFERKRELLLTVLPPRALDQQGQVQTESDAADVVTVVSVQLEPIGDDDGELDIVELLARASSSTEQLAEERGLERVRTSANSHLFLAGHGSPSDGVEDALRFAADLGGVVQAITEDDSPLLSLRTGLATGPVATGVLTRGSLTFTAWGEPVRRALAIGALSRSDEVLVDTSTAGAAPSSWSLDSTDDLVDLDGQTMDVSVLRVGLI